MAFGVQRVWFKNYYVRHWARPFERNISRRRVSIYSLAVLGFSFVGGNTNIGMTAVGGLMIYVAFFAVSLGPVAWLIISEIYPLGIRGRAMGVATLANWVCNYIVSLTFLSLLDVLGAGTTFWIYTIICLFGLWFVYRLVPETKGKTFEEIQHFWKK